MRKILLYTGVLILALSLKASLGFYPVRAEEPEKNRTVPLHKLLIFYSSNCARCIAIKNQIMPGIEERFAGHVTVAYKNIDEMGNYQFLLGLKEKYKAEFVNYWPVFYMEGKFISSSSPAIKNEIIAFLEEAVKDDIPVTEEEVPKVDLLAYFKTFTPLAIIGAGLIDGINPCAFTVIVFFMSFLALQGYRRRDLVIIGVSFVFAVFMTYVLIGLNLFEFLYRLKNFWLVMKIFNVLVGLLSFTLGFLALYDFYKYRKTGETEGLALGLPQAVKNRIHKVIGMHYRVDKNSQKAAPRKSMFRLILSALVTGFLVSILEAVCTGQVYLPTITFVLKTTSIKGQALAYLLLYNLMFVVPLFIIFILALTGVTSDKFAKFLKKHFLTVKLLMAILFFGLGVFLMWKG